MNSRLYKLYTEEIASKLKEEFGYANVMQIPKLEKVTIHVGTGTKSNYNIDSVVENIKKITGQNPVQTLAKKSVSNFKTREGMPIGVKVTLRGDRMYEFIDRLVNIALPRVPDFRGLTQKGFDKTGNFSLGLKDQMPFPEIKAESIEQLHGLQINVTTSAETAKEGAALLTYLGFPFKESKKKTS